MSAARPAAAAGQDHTFLGHLSTQRVTIPPLAVEFHGEIGEVI